MQKMWSYKIYAWNKKITRDERTKWKTNIQRLEWNQTKLDKHKIAWVIVTMLFSFHKCKSCERIIKLLSVVLKPLKIIIFFLKIVHDLQAIFGSQNTTSDFSFILISTYSNPERIVTSILSFFVVAKKILSLFRKNVNYLLLFV